jgi:hypothetical protein
MKIVVPCIEVRSETARALIEHAESKPGHEVTFWPVDSSDEAYWEMYDRLWSEGETFMVVEHDIVIHADVIPQFERCPEPYCAFSYPYLEIPGGWYGLGCARFRDTVIRAFPEAIQNVASISNHAHPPRHWCSLDAFIQWELRRLGTPLHQHLPPVGHLNTGPPSHGCRSL